MRPGALPRPGVGGLDAPLIVTLVLDPASHAWFDALRTAHFPPDRLLVGAHVTLFHALPGDRADAVEAAVRAAAGPVAPFPVQVSGLRFLGRGVAFTLEAPPARRLRAEVAARFAADLTAQDRAAWSPHITVQNKVAPDVARRCLALLAGARPPGPVIATGLALWRYEGGPWAFIAEQAFPPMPSLPVLTPPAGGGEVAGCTSPS